MTLFPITLEELDKLAYAKLYDNARNIGDRSKDYTVNGQREKYKNVKSLLGNNTKQIQNNIWGNERLKNEYRKAMIVYLYNNKHNAFTPEVHRTSQHYDYNVEIMNKNEHVANTTNKMQAVMIFDKEGNMTGIEMFNSQRDLAKSLGINEKQITKRKKQFVELEDGRVLNFQNVNWVKMPVKNL